MHNDADIVCIRREKLIELLRLNEPYSSRPTVVDFFLLVRKTGRRQHDAIDIATWVVHRFLERELGALVVCRCEVTVDMACANTQLQHHGGVARLRELKTHLDGMHDAGQVRARVEQPQL